MAHKKKTGNAQDPQAASVELPVDSSTEKPANKTKKTIVILSTAIVLFCILVCLFLLDKLGFRIVLPSKTIPTGVTIAGVDVGGLTKSEAQVLLESAIGDSYTTTPLVVTTFDKQLEIAPEVSGATLNVKAAIRAARKLDAETLTTLELDIIPYLSLNIDNIQQLISSFSVNFPTDGISTGTQITSETVDGEQKEFLEVTIGTIYYDFSADDFYKTILTAYNNNRFATTYTFNRFEVESVDLDALYDKYCYAAIDAILDPETHEVIPSTDGYRFDLDTAREALAAAQHGDVLKFPFEVVLPAMDTETLKSMLFRDELATYTASQSSSSNRQTNLRLACEALDGLILYPGDTFSYNDTLGERTPEKGYQTASAYVNGETVQSYGGGICQPSSALYYCTLIADLEIVQRHCHTYPSSYVPFGMDATVSWGGPDFKFKNNTDYPIRIDAKADGGSVTVTLVGTELKDYYVEMEYEIWSVTSPQVEYIKVKPNSGHKDGEVKTSGHTGYTVQSYKLKYSKETDELISREKEAYSAYSMQKKVVYKVIKPTTTPTTKPSSTKPSTAKPAETTPSATTPAA